MIRMNPRKFHLSVSLSQEAIDFVNGLGEKHFSVALDKVIRGYRSMQPDHNRAEALEQLRAAVIKLKSDCKCPREAILAWARDAVKGAK